jgi:hypothetical protein
VASGFGGHGLNTTAMAGELIARGIVENDQTWRLFAPYELVWAGGFVGRAAAQTVYWGSRPLDVIKRHVASARERARRRKAVQRARIAREAAARGRAAAEAAAAAPPKKSAESAPESTGAES